MNIIIATGGSGGHIFPALSVAETLRIDGHEVLMMGVFGPWRETVVARGFALEELPARGGSFSSWHAATGFAGGMISSFRRAMVQLRAFHPDAVAGFGGYASFPVVAAARRLRTPTLVHEQNVIPGKANRCLGWFVDRICVSFEDSCKYFRARKTVVTGCPCRAQQILEPGEARERLGLDRDRYTILVLGGSQGSRRINHEFVRALPLLAEADAQVIHLCGPSDAPILEKAYGRQGIPFRVFSFLDEMTVAYSAADVAVSRAGAATVTELAVYGLPTVFIPYPFAGGHQKANALVLVRAGIAKVLEEKSLTTARLADSILAYVRHPQEREVLRRMAACIIRPDAHESIARETVELAK